MSEQAEEIDVSDSGEATRPHSTFLGLLVVSVVALVLAGVVGVSWYSKTHPRFATADTSPTNLVVAAKPMEPAPKPPPPASVDTQGFVSLFNGRDLNGWEGDRRWWSVVDGSIQGRFTNRVGGKLSALVFRGGTVIDFELHLSFRSFGGSGEVLYRAQESPDHEVTGYVCMLTGNGRANRYYPGGSSGGLTIPSRTVTQATEIQQNQASAMRKDDWNEMTIIVRSNRFRHELNGRLVDEVCDTRSTRLSSGLLALAMPCAASDRSQGIQIKDIRLKRLSPAPLPVPQPSPAPSSWSGYNPNIHHSGAVHALAFSPEGEWVASAGQDGTVRLWNSKTGLVGSVFRGHEGAVLAVAFAPGQSDLLASGSADKTIKLWSRRSNTCQAAWRGHEGVIRALAFSADGKTLISGSEDQTIRQWEVATSKQLATADAHQGGVLSMVLSPDGKLLATGGADGVVKVWDARTLGLRDTFQKHERPVTSLAFSSDSRTLASGAGDSVIQFWDLVARRLGSTATLPQPARSLVFWPDDLSVAFGSNDNSLRVHSLTGGSQRILVASLGMAGAFSVSTQGVLAYGCQNGFIGYQRR